MSGNVMTTMHSDDAHRCVKIIRGADGTFGFQEYRREPEDAGRWSLVSDRSLGSFATQGQALAAARADVAWLRDATSSQVKD